jgi:thiosulfate dehydrogenase [quinone] large subunit
MAMDRQGTGLALLRVCLGVFFVFEGVGKVRWLADSSILAGQLATWSAGVGAGSISAWYLHHIAIPGIQLFARLVPLGEFISGLALVCGFWTPLFGFITFFMAMNFHIASGTIFRYAFLTNAYGLPVLGGTLALALGGVRLPWSIR